MRKNELQARIRVLKSRNTTLSSLNNQLDIEWKEVSIIILHILLIIETKRYESFKASLKV